MSQNFTGVIIEESLENKSVLKNIKIIKTKVEQVTEKHQTPWIKKWTLHTVIIPEKDASFIAKIISESLDSLHQWYADYKNDSHHYIIFKNKIFLINRKTLSLIACLKIQKSESLLYLWDLPLCSQCDKNYMHCPNLSRYSLISKLCLPS